MSIIEKSIIDAIFRNLYAFFLLQEKTCDLVTDRVNVAEMQKHYQKKIFRGAEVLEKHFFSRK